MRNFFDNLTRIMAMPVDDNERFHMIRSLVMETRVPGVSRVSERATDDRWPMRAPTRRKKLNVAEVSAKLRLAYLTRNSYVYRKEAFSALLLLRRADGAELQSVLDKLIAEIKRNGADGIETLVLTCADRIALRGDARAKEHARAAIAALAGHLNYWNTATPPNLKIPLGRVSSFVVLDLRADAVREMLNQLVQQSRDSGEVQSMLDLLDSRQTRDGLCNLPKMPNQMGNVSQSDTNREQNCDDHGSAGPAKGGTVGGALGDLITGGCSLAPPEVIDTMGARIKAMDECFARRGAVAGERSPRLDVALDPVTDAILAALLVEAVKAYGEYVVRTVEETSRWKEYTTELNKVNKDWGEAVKDAENAKGADDTIREGEEELAAALRERDEADKQFENAVTDEEVEAAQKAQMEAQKKVDEATKKIEDAKAAKERAKKSEEIVSDSAKKADEKKPKGDFSPEDPFNSADCRKAMGDPDDRLLSERLGDDWTSWNETRGRLPHIWDPAPDDLQPYDALRVPFCGMDDGTVSNPAEKCNVPVDCLEGRPDETCGCDGSPSGEARLISSMTAAACQDVRCPDGTVSVAQGFVCVCTESTENGTRPPPTPPIIAAQFGNGRTTIPQEASPTFNLVRTLFQDFMRNRR